MPAKKSTISSRIHLLDMKIIHSEMKSPEGFVQCSIEQYTSIFNLNFAFNLETQKIRADFEVEITTVSKTDTNPEEATGHLKFHYFFRIDNMGTLVKKQENLVEIDGALGNALAAITYSTTRGILMSKFQGTALCDFILPVKDPAELLE